MKLAPCLVIPAYNHAEALEGTIAGLENLGLPCIVVDDGSSDGTPEKLGELRERFAWLETHRRAQNGGKGAAVQDGIRAALRRGFTHALLVDADGQHDPTDAPKFLEAARSDPEALILGTPRFDAAAPRARVWGREITNALVWLQTLSFAARDALCGYRLYPIWRYERELCGTDKLRMDYDLDVLVRILWAGAPVVNIPTKVSYPSDGISHFDYLRDNLRLARVHTKLILGMLARSPLLIGRKAAAFLGIARRPGMGSWSTRKELSSPFWIRLMVRIYRLMGRRLCELLLYPIVLYFWISSGKNRRASLQFQRRLGAPGARLYLMSYLQMLEFGRALLDKFIVWYKPIGYEALECHGRMELRSLIDQGKGAVLIGAHLGNIEVMRAISHDIRGLKVNALMFTSHTPHFNAVVSEANPDVNLRMIRTETPGPELVLDLRQRIASGEVVAMMGDRVMPGSPEKSLIFPFLGADASFPTGPFIVASMLECPVLLVLCFRRRSGGYEVYFEKIADRLELPRKERAAALTTAVGDYVTRLEGYCRRYPLHWFNFYDFWAMPEGSPSKTISSPEELLNTASTAPSRPRR